MPSHYGKKKPMGKKPKKNGKKKRKGLTAKQKKLPHALRAAILKKQRGGKQCVKHIAVKERQKGITLCQVVDL